MPSSRKSLLLITCDRHPHLAEDDQQLLKELQALGIAYEVRAWNRIAAHELHGFAALIFRSPWDYFMKLEPFCAWLEEVEKISIPVFNSIATIRRNMDKHYLRELNDFAVPTLWVERMEDLASAAIPWEDLVLKPTIGAAGFQIQRCTRSELLSGEIKLRTLFRRSTLMIQPHLSRLRKEGEFSLIFFNGQYSHAVLKISADGDFRVQEKFGGKTMVEQPSKELIEDSTQILQRMDPDALYGRVDWVPFEDRWCVGEVELFEPSLYLSYHAKAAERFAQAIKSRMQIAAPN